MTQLRQRMIEDMGIRNLADATQLAYLQQVISYAVHFHRSPDAFGPETVRAYQVYSSNPEALAQQRQRRHRRPALSVQGYTQTALGRDAIPMPKRPFKLPVILSREEVMHCCLCAS